jgi:PST family polysaccharide transporter
MGISVSNLGELKKRSVQGGAISLLSRLASVGVQLLSTVILARLLDPDDYGIVVMVTAVTALAGMFGDLGLATSAVRQQDLTHAQSSNLFWCTMLLGLSLTGVVALASPLAAWFYGRQEVLTATLALSLNFFFGSVGNLPGALLAREMRFGRAALGAIVGSVLGLGVSAFLAWKGYRHWALIWGAVTGTVATSGMLMLLASFRPGLPSRGTGLREMVGFGVKITAFDFINYFHRNLDNLLIGRFWGSESVGFYSRAYSLLMMPILHIRGPINAVALPALSQLQHEPEDFRKYYRRMVEILALLSMPLTAFLFVASASVIEVALTSRWLAVSPIFRILAVVAFIQPVMTTWGLVLLSLGQARRYLTVGVVNTLFSAVGFVAGLPWGPEGVAIGYAIATYVSLLPILIMGFKNSPLRLRDFFGPIALAAGASLGAATVMSLAGHFCETSVPLATLTVLGIGFLVVFLVILILLPGGRQELAKHLRLFATLLPSRRTRSA